VVPPPRGADTLEVGLSPDATRKAAEFEFCALSDAASAALMVPVAVPGVKPVMDVPGERPTSPVTTVGPVLVTVVPARTP
jgi:hypothetical protein